jgi:predicted RNase H-like HicB family nuclease
MEIAKMRRIIIHRSEPDEDVAYWVECPSLGIASMGDTVEEAIELHIEDLVANDGAVPPEDMPDLPITQELAI